MKGSTFGWIFQDRLYFDDSLILCRISPHNLLMEIESKLCSVASALTACQWIRTSDCQTTNYNFPLSIKRLVYFHALPQEYVLTSRGKLLRKITTKRKVMKRTEKDGVIWVDYDRLCGTTLLYGFAFWTTTHGICQLTSLILFFLK